MCIRDRFDCVASRYGVRMQGATEVALTVLDVLGYLDEIPVCVGYEIDGEVTKDFPVTAKLKKAKPVYEKLPGWKEEIRGITEYEKLPENCRKSVSYTHLDVYKRQLLCKWKSYWNNSYGCWICGMGNFTGYEILL